jgi:RNA polymerase sigma-70 factor (ECF subfamily)
VGEAQLDEVLPAAQQGEAWALRVVYEELAPRVQAYLRARGASEPEDLTSEVFVTVFPRLASVTGGAAGLRTFTFSVAHARLVDDLRRRSRREPVSSYDPDTDPRTSASAEEEGIVKVQTDRVRRLLETLVPDQRDVLVLRLLGDLTVEQVAETLGKSTGAVKQLQRRGLIALRRLLEEPT